jgi:hypothetical protein
MVFLFSLANFFAVSSGTIASLVMTTSFARIGLGPYPNSYGYFGNQRQAHGIPQHIMIAQTTAVIRKPCQRVETPLACFAVRHHQSLIFVII